MAIYLISFFTSCLLLNLSEKNKNKLGVRFILTIIALFIPCALAFLRHYSIGTDIQVYVKRLFECAQNSSSFVEYLNMHWFSIWKNNYVYDYEIGFTGMIYFATKITNNLQFILASIHILIVFPIYFGIRKFRSLDKSLWLSMLTFYLMFYNVSLNIMRQYIAIAIMFYGISCLLNETNGKIKFWVTLPIAILFHNSALLGILIYIIYMLVYKNEKLMIKISKHRFSVQKIFLFLIFIFGIVIITNSSIIVKILEILNIERYENYVRGTVSFVRSSIIKIIPIVILLFFIGKKFVNENKDAYFLLSMFIVDCIIVQFSSVNPYAIRIGYFFSIFNVVLFPSLCNLHKDGRDNKMILFVVVYLLFYWYYNFVFIGANETIPYVFYNKIV